MNLESIDINLIRGILLICLILGFAGIWAWAWSRKRKETFEEMSRLPLEEDFGQVPQQDSKQDKS